VRAHLRRAGLTRAVLSAEPARAFGRHEASGPNETWIGDVLVGPFVPPPGGRQPSGQAVRAGRRLQPAAGPWAVDDRGEHRSGQDVLRSAIARRGVPQILHVDNGAPYANHQMARACAVLDVHPSVSERPQTARRARRLINADRVLGSV
jgi:hypothetical protein